MWPDGNVRDHNHQNDGGGRDSSQAPFGRQHPSSFPPPHRPTRKLHVKRLAPAERLRPLLDGLCRDKGGSNLLGDAPGLSLLRAGSSREQKGSRTTQPRVFSLLSPYRPYPYRSFTPPGLIQLLVMPFPTRRK